MELQPNTILDRIQTLNQNFKPISRAIQIQTLLSSMVFASFASAAIEMNKVPSIELTTAVPGAVVQKVENITDRSQLSVLHNTSLFNQTLNLPGWNAYTRNAPVAQGIMNAFAVHTNADATSAQPTDAVFYVGRKVGRSGVWELENAGDYFAKIDGRPLKGLTIKGYGGNLSANRLQPEGSMDAAEAYRDMLITKILMEKNVDTYVGAITIVRPSAAGLKSNFIRLSRTSLRLNDVMDRTGQELKSTVEHLTQLLADEVGHKMTPEEFANWLVLRSAITLASKEQARVKSSNNNKDNFGFAELVDFGEANYAPLTYVPGSDSNVSLQPVGQETLGDHVVTAASHLATEYGFKINAPAIFKAAYQHEFDRLEAKDHSRIDLDSASARDLKKVGLSDNSVAQILALRQERPFGLLTTAEIMNKMATAEDRKVLQERTTTAFMRLSNGVILPNVLIEEIGGAKGLRTMITGLLSDLGSKVTDASITKAKISEFVQAYMKTKGTDVYQAYANYYGAHVEEILQTRVSELVTHDPNFASRETAKLEASRAYICRGLF